MKNYLLVAVLAASSAQANELIVTQQQANGANTITVDLLPSADVGSVSFYIDTGVRGNDASIDLSACGPQATGKSGGCYVFDGVVVGGFYSPDMQPQSRSRNVQFGRIVVRGQASNVSGGRGGSTVANPPAATVSSVEVTDVFGKAISSSIRSN